MKNINPISNAWLTIAAESATVHQIAHAINAICEWNWVAGYSFAHIALDDYNLDDYSIDFCLNEERISECVNYRISLRYDPLPDYESLPVWERSYLDDEYELRDTTISLLEWLRKTPESERDDAWIILDGFDTADDSELEDHVFADIVKDWKKEQEGIIND